MERDLSLLKDVPTQVKDLELVKRLGADRAIDYTKEALPPNGESYDLIIDVIGKDSVPRWL